MTKIGGGKQQKKTQEMTDMLELVGKDFRQLYKYGQKSKNPDE